MNKKPEDQVKSSCIARLKFWQLKGVVIDFDDVSNLGRKQTRFGYVMHTKKGKRDIIILLKVNTTLWCYLVECKAPTGGVWKQDQQDYSKKFYGLTNCIYEVVSNPKQVDVTIEKITNYSQTILDNIKAPQ